MASEGATSFTFDAYGQQVSAGTSSYTWDAFNRMTGAAGPGDTVGLTYEGMSGEVASDSSASYSRNPAGDITGVDAAAGGKAIALDDQHADLSGLFTASGTTLTGSATYSPWGQVLGTSGPTVQVGYQGQWTDPLSGQVSMGSRFYQPQTGGFTSKDTYTGAEGGAASVSDNLYAYGNDNPVTVTDPSGHSPSGSSGYGNITAGDVAAAWGRAGEAKARAAGASAAAAAARGTAAVLSAAATGAEILARTLNSAAQKAQELAAQAAQLAARAFAAAARQLTVATSWQDKANAAWASARWHTANSLDIFNPVGDAANVWDAAKETGIALYDEARAGAAIITWGILEIAAEGAQLASDALHEASQVLAAAARGAAAAAVIATGAADAAERYARSMAAQAAADEAIASQDVAEAESLASAYYAQEQRRLAALRAAAERAVKRAAERAARAVKTAAKVVARVAVKAAKVAYKVSGAQSIVSCATNPTLSSCLQAAAAVAMIAATVATGGAAGAADVAAEGAIAATEDVAVDATEEVGADAAASCGMSFTAGTRVLLASGAAVPISQLKPGDKVLATSTTTGKTQAETVTAVLVHHDTDLYDLKVRAQGKTTVIDTTSNHLFWVPGSGGHAGRWVKAGALKYGTHLRTAASGGTAVVLGGSVPRQQDGWMWDITVPGNNDHDFYVQTATTGVLVHNCGGSVLSILGKAVQTVNPGGRNLVIGAVGGAAGNFYDGVVSGDRNWKLVGVTALGAVTGAASNLKLPGGIIGSMAIGGAAGAANSAEGQEISSGTVNSGGWVVYNSLIGGAENGLGTWAGDSFATEGMSAAARTESANVGSAGLSITQGVVCGGTDVAKWSNC